MNDLHWAKLFMERKKRGYCKRSKWAGFDIVVDVNKLEDNDHTDSDFIIFARDKKHFTYEEFENWDMKTN